jgi:hypothetical protein
MFTPQRCRWFVAKRVSILVLLLTKPLNYVAVNALRAQLHRSEIG